jgi:AAA family ATP:ADP antiporter
MWAGLTEVLRSRYLMLICAHVALLSLTSTFLYFQQAAIVAGAFDSPAERTRVFALIDLSVGVTTLAVQVLFTGRLMMRFGAGAALALLAIVTAAGFAAIAIAPVLAVVIGFQAVKRATEFSLANPARETLFTVVTREQMYKSKSFIDTAVFRGADAASGWIYTALRQAAALEAALVAWLTVPVALGWALMLLKLGAMQRKQAGRSSDDGQAGQA